MKINHAPPFSELVQHRAQQTQFVQKWLKLGLLCLNGTILETKAAELYDSQSIMSPSPPPHPPEQTTPNFVKLEQPIVRSIGIKELDVFFD